MKTYTMVALLALFSGCAGNCNANGCTYIGANGLPYMLGIPEAETNVATSTN